MGLTTVQKVTYSGGNLVVIVPKKIIEIMNISKGDYLQIDWGELIKAKKKNTLKENKLDNEESLPKL